MWNRFFCIVCDYYDVAGMSLSFARRLPLYVGVREQLSRASTVDALVVAEEKIWSGRGEGERRRERFCSPLVL